MNDISEIVYPYLKILFGIIILIILYFGVVVRKKVVERYESGKKQKVKITNFFKKGFLIKTYYKTGKLNKIVPYRNGVIHGKVKTLFKSGNVYIMDIYSEGELMEYRIFDQIGKEIKKEILNK